MYLTEEKSVDEWSRIDECKPREFKEVLFLLEDGSMQVGYYINCGSYTRLKLGHTSKDIELWKVRPTHWISLPCISGLQKKPP